MMVIIVMVMMLFDSGGSVRVVRFRLVLFRVSSVVVWLWFVFVWCLFIGLVSVLVVFSRVNRVILDGLKLWVCISLIGMVV